MNFEVSYIDRRARSLIRSRKHTRQHPRIRHSLPLQPYSVRSQIHPLEPHQREIHHEMQTHQLRIIVKSSECLPNLVAIEVYRRRDIANTGSDNEEVAASAS